MKKRVGASGRLLALACATALVAAPLQANDPGFPLSPGGGAGTSGTLPSSYGYPGLPVSRRPVKPAILKGVTKPATTLRGTADELDAIISSTHSPDGTGWFHMLPPASNGTVTVHYYGNVQIDLDFAAFSKGQGFVGLEVSPAFNGGVAVVSVGGERRASQVVKTGTQSFQLNRMAGAGLLDPGVELRVKKSPTAAVAALVKLDKIGNLVRIEQQHK
jgi:hypothetical protein